MNAPRKLTLQDMTLTWDHHVLPKLPRHVPVRKPITVNQYGVTPMSDALADALAVTDRVQR